MGVEGKFASKPTHVVVERSLLLTRRASPQGCLKAQQLASSAAGEQVLETEVSLSDLTLEVAPFTSACCFFQGSQSRLHLRGRVFTREQISGGGDHCGLLYF